MSQRCGVIKSFSEVPKDASEPAIPYVFRAELANHRFVGHAGDELVASGKGMTRRAAQESALGEAIERYSSMCSQLENLIFSARQDLRLENLDPRALVLYRPEQYSELPYAPYREGTRLGWIPARSLVNTGAILVPALAANLAYQVHSSDEYLFGPNSNGLGAGSSLVDAILAATLEVIERDAFLITWFARLPCVEVDPGTHPDGDIRLLSESYRRRGVVVKLFRLPVDHPVHVFMALAVGDQGAEPAAVVGLGADLDPARAATRAVLEVGQVRPALRMRLRDSTELRRLDELVADPSEVSTLQDHDLLYASPAMLHAWSFLEGGSAGHFDWHRDAQGEPFPETSLGRLDRLASYFASVGQDVLYVDLTPPDMRALGISTTRVLIPGFQPIDFGSTELRLGGSRLFELPHRLGFAKAILSPDDLNDLPHPLA